MFGLEKRKLEVAARFPAHGRMIEAGGESIHVRTCGSGPDLVLLHGASGNLRDMELSLMEDLAHRFRVIALDRPGLGWSSDRGGRGLSPLRQADILRAACSRIGAKNPYVLGHSYGGAVALAWAILNRDCPGLVVLSGATMPWEGDVGPFYSIVGSDFGRQVLLPFLSAMADRRKFQEGVAAVFAPQTAPENYLDATGVELLLLEDRFWINTRQIRDLGADLSRMRPHYQRIIAPVEIIHGRQDGTVPCHLHAEPLAKILASARLTVIEDAGHMPHHTHKRDVLAACDRLLRA